VVCFLKINIELIRIRAIERKLIVHECR